MNPRTSTLALLPILAMLAGCSTPDAPDPLIKSPGTGSSFTYKSHLKDSTGQKDPKSEQTLLNTVGPTGLTYEGKSNVVSFIEGVDTSYVVYEGNGDVTAYQPELTLPSPQMPFLIIPGRWVTFPFGTKNPVAVPGYSTTTTLPMIPVPVTINVTGTTSYIGTENLQIGTETIATQKGLLTINSTVSSLIASGPVTSIDTFWFAQKLGVFVKEDGLDVGKIPVYADGILGGRFRMLMSYSLK